MKKFHIVGVIKTIKWSSKTIAAIKTYPLSNEEDTAETVNFIEKVLEFWKIVSVKYMVT